MPAKPAKKKVAVKKSTAPVKATKKPAAAKSTKKPVAKSKAPKRVAAKAARKVAAKPPKMAVAKAAKASKKVVAKAAKAPVDAIKKPTRPLPANDAPIVPHEKTIDMTEKAPPPKPKATISRAKAVALANTYLKEHVGKADLYAPRASRFRLGSIVDRNGIINICFCHEADDFDPVITTLGAKCLESLVSAHPQLKAFEIDVQTIRM